MTGVQTCALPIYIGPSNEHPGLISFRMDWLDLLTVQGTLKSLLQHHSSTALIFQHSASFMDGLVRSPCSPRDSQEISPTPQCNNYQHQHHRVSILGHSAFFMLQLSHPYMTTGKIIALTRQTFVGKVMSLLFNMLSRLVIVFLPRSKRLLISWLQSPSSWDFGAQENKVSHCFHGYPIYLP